MGVGCTVGNAVRTEERTFGACFDFLLLVRHQKGSPRSNHVVVSGYLVGEHTVAVRQNHRVVFRILVGVVLMIPIDGFSLGVGSCFGGRRVGEVHQQVVAAQRHLRDDGLHDIVLGIGECAIDVHAGRDDFAGDEVVSVHLIVHTGSQHLHGACFDSGFAHLVQTIVDDHYGAHFVYHATDRGTYEHVRIRAHINSRCLGRSGDTVARGERIVVIPSVVPFEDDRQVERELARRLYRFAGIGTSSGWSTGVETHMHIHIRTP